MSISSYVIRIIWSLKDSKWKDMKWNFCSALCSLPVWVSQKWSSSYSLADGFHVEGVGEDRLLPSETCPLLNVQGLRPQRYLFNVWWVLLCENLAIGNLREISESVSYRGERVSLRVTKNGWLQEMERGSFNMAHPDQRGRSHWNRSGQIMPKRR